MLDTVLDKGRPSVEHFDVEHVMTPKNMPKLRLFYVAPTILLLTLAVWPLIRGAETLYTRDVLTSHYPLKSAQAETLRQGKIPLIDPYRAGGQPLLGNPNALPLYPSNLLYLVASPLWALNAHFWLHLLLAPVSFYWLGRAWGIRRSAAWAGGVCYASSGFFLSLLNLYNLVAGAALAPAFIAACLDAWNRDRLPSSSRRRLAVAGVLWGLLILAGDPMFAALALGLAFAAVMARGQSAANAARGPSANAPWRAHGLPSALVVLCGTLLAAPMLIEFLRILPLSYRGYWQFSIRAALSQSWDPRSVLEWFLPFFFGRPDFTFWGMSFYGGNPPLLYSLYPGLLSLGLVISSGRPRSRGAWWAWGATLAGLFMAAGAWNPVVRALYALPGASALRYPVKLWLIVALGCSLLCAIGFERLLDDGGRRLSRIFGGMTVVYLVAWGLLLRQPPALISFLQQLDPERLNHATLMREVSRWSALSLFSLITLGLLALIVRLSRNRPAAGGALLLVTHLLAQGFFLQPLYDGDASEFYQRPPRVLLAVPSGSAPNGSAPNGSTPPGSAHQGSTFVHGDFRDLFGKVAIQPLRLFPDPRFFWLSRLQYDELHPFAGAARGQRYELNHSPEGLDSFFSISVSRAIQQQDDEGRLRLLAAIGVDRLILGRRIAPEAADLVDLQAVAPGPPRDTFVYRLPQAAPQVLLAGTVLRAPEMSSALRILTAETFDPRTMVVLPGDGPELRGELGHVDIVTDGHEVLEVETSSKNAGVLLTQRAFLDIYRATIDGQPAPLVVGNLERLAIEIPPGKHRVRIWADRRPTRLAWLAALVGVIGLVVVGRRRRGEARHRRGEDATTGASDEG